MARNTGKPGQESAVRVTLESLRCGIIVWAVIGCSIDTRPQLDPNRSGDGGVDGGDVDGGDTDAERPDDAATDAGDDANVDDPSLLDAPPAPQLGDLSLDLAFHAVIQLGELVLGLHAASGVSILDFEDPRSPAVAASLPTSGRVVAVAFDAERQVVFTLTETGDLRAYRVFDHGTPTRIAQLDAVEPSGAMFRDLARVGNRLFLLGSGSIVPVDVIFGADTSAALSALFEVAIDDRALRIAAGGHGLYVAFEGGVVRAFTAVAAPVQVGELELGAEIVDWVVRGQRLSLVLAGRGVREVVLRAGGASDELLEISLTDVVDLERSGQLLFVTLERGLVLAIDVAMPNAPRTLVLHDAPVPDWVAVVNGDLVLGSGRSLSVLGVPPIVHSAVPRSIANALPSHARIPLAFSKPLSAQTVTAGNFPLHCDEAPIDSDVHLSFDARTVIVVPDTNLPADQECVLRIDGARDRFGLPASAAEGLLDFGVSDSASVVRNPDSTQEHTADGRFTGWSSRSGDAYEYADVEPALGMLGRVHVDHDGTRLWVLADFLHGAESLAPDCYGVVRLLADNEHWETRLFGDERVEVRRNGNLLGGGDDRVLGGYAFGASPAEVQPHTVYELAIELPPGGFSLAVAAPGSSFSCEHRELDPIVLDGMTSAAGTALEPSALPAQPVAPTDLEPIGIVGSLTPTLRWLPNAEPSLFTSYEVEIATAGNAPRLVYRAQSSLPMLEVPAGALSRDTSYVFRVTAFNLLGVATSAPSAFATTATDAPDAPELTSVEPDRLPQGTPTLLTLTGEGFVAGATAFLDGVALSTTFVSATELDAALPATLSSEARTAVLIVRNLPADDSTQSNAIPLEIVGPCDHGECLPGDALEDACSSCTSSVCDDAPECCTDGWDAACIAAAASSASCTCNAPALANLSVVSGIEGTDTPLHVELQDAPEGYDYELVLTPDVGDATVLDCDYVAGDPVGCDATVPGSLAAGEYTASMRVTDSGVSYETGGTPSAFTQTAP